ncbi:hypothetical protein PC120_g921 [Phytophthora cactorum]|nr:hypothetical protein PC120_g921 [Phytophthora cactorum]
MLELLSKESTATSVPAEQVAASNTEEEEKGGWKDL